MHDFMHDSNLLREFIEQDSQAAFGKLVERHLNMVYSTALREIGDVMLAEDVTQVVFLLLAQKAKTLHSEMGLAGWLFQTARFASQNARRQEEKRKQVEQSAAEEMMHKAQYGAGRDAALWAEIDPLLHEAMSTLDNADRSAVLLRCFEGHSLKETGQALGLSEAAAGKRVSRALEKLRRYFSKRGVALSLAGLAALLSSNAVQAAPLSCKTAVLAAISPSSGAITASALSTKAVTLSQTMQRSLLIGNIKLAAVVLCSTAFVGVGGTKLVQSLATAPASTLTQNQVSMQGQQNSEPRTNNKEENMQIKKTLKTALTGATIAAAMSTPAFADDINARVKSVDVATHTITVLEGGKELAFTVSPATTYLDSKDREIKAENNGDQLEAGVKAGLLKEGTRLSLKFDAAKLASIVKLRDFRK